MNRLIAQRHGCSVVSDRHKLAIEIRVLGRVDALVDGRSLPLREGKQRGVLAILALRANHTVSADELIDGLWADRPPASAAKNLQSFVSQLRKALASDDAEASILTRGRGYELRVAEEAVDALRFEQLVEEAAREPAGAGANGLAGAALELWRGAPLADVASEPFAGPEIGRLEELHLRAVELAIDAELAAGRHAEAIARLEALIAEEPLRERLHAQRMLALYRDGRQSEALDAYREARETLIEQIGVEPGPELKRLQEQILAQDPSLDAPPPIVELPVQLEGGSPLLAGRERELDWLRSALGAGARGPGRLRDGLGAVGDRKDAAGGRARGRGPGRAAPRSSTPAVANSPRGRWRPSPRPPRATDRRCWCSTTPTTPPRACSRPPRRSPASPRAGRS